MNITNKAEHVSHKLETTTVYTIGNFSVSVDRIFRKENEETLAEIITKLIKHEVENT